jgi:hypothetical protein
MQTFAHWTGLGFLSNNQTGDHVVVLGNGSFNFSAGSNDTSLQSTGWGDVSASFSFGNNNVTTAGGNDFIVFAPTDGYTVSNAHTGDGNDTLVSLAKSISNMFGGAGDNTFVGGAGDYIDNSEGSGRIFLIDKLPGQSGSVYVNTGAPAPALPTPPSPPGAPTVVAPAVHVGDTVVSLVFLQFATRDTLHVTDYGAIEYESPIDHHKLDIYGMVPNGADGHPVLQILGMNPIDYLITTGQLEVNWSGAKG